MPASSLPGLPGTAGVGIPSTALESKQHRDITQISPGQSSEAPAGEAAQNRAEEPGILGGRTGTRGAF